MSGFHMFTVGDEEYQCLQLDAFTTNSYLLKMKSMIGGLMGSGMDSDASNLLSLIDQKTLDDLVFPIFDKCSLTCTSKKVKLVDKKGMNEVFTAETLDDFYAVIWEVLKYNFGPFISKMAKNLFGLELTDLESLIRNKMKEVGKLSSGKTSTENSGSGDQ